jgi:predicted nicotinamide N-methyase
MDEELFFEAIIASERVGRWLSDLRAGTRSAATIANANADDATAARSIAAAAKAAEALAKAVAAENMSGGPYSEAAEDQGASRVLTALMARLCAAEGGEDDDDEEEEQQQPPPQSPLTAARRNALAAAGRLMAALSGPMACGGRVVSFSVEALALPPRHMPLRVREGAISDGLGARVWALAHVALRELAAAKPCLVRGCSVLEIGAGTGLLGVAAARLGAASVVLSDHEPAVLRILRACAHLNAPAVEQARGGGGEGEGDGEDDDDSSNALPSVHSSEAETVDGEEDEEQEEPKPPHQDPSSASWDAASGAVQVRAFDWADSIARLDGEADAAPLRLALPDDEKANDYPPTLPLDQTFDVVLGSEVMYEPVHARLVAAALAHRLSPRGSSARALLACAGRERRVFEAFARHCAERGLRYRAVAVRPTAADYSDGILARHRAAAAVVGGGVGVGSSGNGSKAAASSAATPASAASSGVEYEGGFLLMAVDWGEDAVGAGGGWHRDDFVEGLVDGSAAPLETT